MPKGPYALRSRIMWLRTVFAQTHGAPVRHSEPACRPCVILNQLAKGKQIEFGSLSNGSAFCEAKTAKLGGA